MIIWLINPHCPKRTIHIHTETHTELEKNYRITKILPSSLQLQLNFPSPTFRFGDSQVVLFFFFFLFCEGQSASVELHKLIHGTHLRLCILKHPQQVFEQHHFASNNHPIIAVAGLVYELLKQRVVDDFGVYEVPPSGFSDVNGVEFFGDQLVGGVIRCSNGAGAGCAAEFGDWRQSFNGWLELC